MVVPAAGVVGALGVDGPDAAVIVGVRRAQPPPVSAAAVVGDTLAVAARAASKVRQPDTILGEIAIVAGRPANFIAGQQEYFGGKTICAGGKAAVPAACAVQVRDFYLLNSCPDVAVDEVVERSVQVCVDAGILVGVIVAERVRCVDVLHQQPSTVAAIVIDAGRLALMHDDEIFGRTVDFDFDDAANGLCA